MAGQLEVIVTKNTYNFVNRAVKAVIYGRQVLILSQSRSLMHTLVHHGFLLLAANPTALEPYTDHHF